MGLDADDLQEIIEEFLVEAGDFIEQLDQDLVALETNPTDSALLNRIFRSLHTMKGNANFLNSEPIFAAIAQVAHAAEDVMGGLRANKIQMSRPIMDAVLAALDTIKHMFAQIKSGNKSTPTIEPLVLRLRSFLEARPAPVVPVTTSKPEAANQPEVAPVGPVTAKKSEAAAEAPKPSPPAIIAAGATAIGPSPAATPTDSLSEEDRQELRQDFLDESQELVDKIDAALLKLESGSGEPKLIDEIFRGVHTLKGTSAFLGFQEISQLAHLAEEVLKGIRSGTISVSVPLMDTLGTVVDHWKRLLSSMAQNRSTAEQTTISQTLLAQLQRLLGSPPATTPGIVAPNGKTATAPPNQPASPPKSPVDSHEAKPQGHQPETMGNKEAAAKGEASSEQTIRVEAGRLDKLMNMVGELVLGRNRLSQVIRTLMDQVADDRACQDLVAAFDFIAFVTADLQTAVLKTRMQPIGKIFNRFTRTVRDLARELGKEVRLVIAGAETELDKSVIDELGDPLIHLLRNSVDHGIESPEIRKQMGKPEGGTITLAALHVGNHIHIEIRDDGKGIDMQAVREKAVSQGLISAEDSARLSPQQIFDFIFRAGFSTAKAVTKISGRGVGLDVVKTCIEKLNGTVVLTSEPGKGTVFTIRLPLTLAIIQALQVHVGNEIFAIPISSVAETLRIYPHQIQTISGKEVVQFRHSIIPLVRLEMLFGMEVPARHSDRIYVVLVGIAETKVGIIVDKILGQEEIVVKSLGKLLENIPGISGACIRGDGRVTLILDIASLMRLLPTTPLATSPAHLPKGTCKITPHRDKPLSILLVEDSRSERKRSRLIIEAKGYRVVEAVDGKEALGKLLDHQIDMVITDIEMPELDGYTLTTKIREHSKYRNIPVIAVSSHKEMVDRIKGLESGINTYLPKPLQEAELLAAIKNFIA